MKVPALVLAAVGATQATTFAIFSRDQTNNAAGGGGGTHNQYCNVVVWLDDNVDVKSNTNYVATAPLDCTPGATTGFYLFDYEYKAGIADGGYVSPSGKVSGGWIQRQAGCKPRGARDALDSHVHKTSASAFSELIENVSTSLSFSTDSLTAS